MDRDTRAAHVVQYRRAMDIIAEHMRHVRVNDTDDPTVVAYRQLNQGLRALAKEALDFLTEAGHVALAEALVAEARAKRYHALQVQLSLSVTVTQADIAAQTAEVEHLLAR